MGYPSGDVMMATILAIPLWNIGGGGTTTNNNNNGTMMMMYYYKTIAVAMVISSGLGRMYVLAHHLVDVVSGACITLIIHKMIVLLGYEPTQTKWWHPFVMQACYFCFEMCCTTKQNLS